MSKGFGQSSSWAVLIFEFKGTALLVYFAITGDHNPLVTSLALFTTYLLFAVISLGHFNPAVSLAVWLSDMNKEEKDENGQVKERDWLNYFTSFFARIIAQIAGGAIGAFLAYGVLARHRPDGSFAVNPVFITKLCPKDPYDPKQCDTTGELQLQVYLVQAFCSFLLCLTYANVPKDTTSKDNIVKAICISLAFFGLAHIGGVAGASFNPVLSGSTMFFQHFASSEPSDPNAYLKAYLIGPLLGALFAIPFNMCINCADSMLDFEDDEQAKNQANQAPVQTRMQDVSGKPANNDPAATDKSALLGNNDTEDPKNTGNPGT